MDKYQIAIAIVGGILIFLWLKTGLEPWVIETVCENLINCEALRDE